jgi:cytochrome c peroxidase
MTVKTEALRGMRDTAHYFHDGRLLTFDDTVEFVNLMLGTKLTAQEKKDLGGRISYMDIPK